MSQFTPENPPARTGISALDRAEALSRAPRALHGPSLLKDPTEFPKSSRGTYWDPDRDRPFDLPILEKAYNTDSFIRQGVDKYVELCTKHGWYLDCETPEPVDYLRYRFQVMGMMTDKPFSILVDELVQDFVKYSNAFWIKKRQVIPNQPHMPEQGVGGKQLPVAAYFRADPKLMSPYWSKDGRKFLGWRYTPRNSSGMIGKPLIYPRQDVIHFAFNVPAGECWGNPSLLPVLEDVREYRRCEEYVIKLLYKHLNPLLHHKVPDNTGLGVGRQEDVDAAAAAHAVIAPDGLIVTPPGHEITMLGAESHALRGEGYMELLKSRVYAGLGVNQLVMGEGETTTTGSADVMTANMHNRAKLYQRQLGELLTERVLFELMMEGGYDPLNRLDLVTWTWNDIETEAQIARENHTIQKWTNNLLTLSEARREIKKKPLTDQELQETYTYVVTIPEMEAAAEAKARSEPGTTGASKQSASRARPSNQHGTRTGPKIRPR